MNGGPDGFCNRATPVSQDFQAPLCNTENPVRVFRKHIKTLRAENVCERMKRFIVLALSSIRSLSRRRSIAPPGQEGAMGRANLQRNQSPCSETQKHEAGGSGDTDGRPRIPQFAVLHL